MQNWPNISYFALIMTHFDQSLCLNLANSFFCLLYTWLKCFQFKQKFWKGVFCLNNLSATKYVFWQGGRRGYPISDCSDKGWGRVGQFLIFCWQGGRGGLDPPFLADIICDQSLTMLALHTHCFTKRFTVLGENDTTTSVKHFHTIFCQKGAQNFAKVLGTIYSSTANV